MGDYEKAIKLGDIMDMIQRVTEEAATTRREKIIAFAKAFMEMREGGGPVAISEQEEQMLQSRVTDRTLILLPSVLKELFVLHGLYDRLPVFVHFSPAYVLGGEARMVLFNPPPSLQEQPYPYPGDDDNFHWDSRPWS